MTITPLSFDQEWTYFAPMQAFSQQFELPGKVLYFPSRYLDLASKK
jgi:hypothetical protein